MGYRKDILDEAANLVEGDRNASYGDPNQDFRRTAAMWSVYISGVMDRKETWNDHDLLDPWDIAWMMILLKSSRSTVSPNKRDHYVDAAGYAACGADCGVEDEEKPVGDFYSGDLDDSYHDARVRDAVDLLLDTEGYNKVVSALKDAAGGEDGECD